MDSNNENSSIDAIINHMPHVMILPFPVLGRTNPMLQFAKRLSSKGLQVTLATTPAFATAAAASHNHLTRSLPSLTIATISDDLDQLETAFSNNTITVDAFIEGFERIAPRGLARLIKEKSLANPVRCLVYDSSLPWALGIARENGVYGASFSPQSCAVSLIFCHVYKGFLDAPPLVEGGGGGVLAPGLPEMEVAELPTFVREVGRHPVLEKLALRQFENFDEADWQFFNTVDILEDEVLKWMLRQWPRVTTIGPTIPSLYLDKCLEDDKEYGLNLFTPEFDTCIQWLDTKEDGSTIFVSFGSIAALGEQQMEELASGLKNSNKPFLWVVRASEHNKLPPNFKHELVSSKNGLIVNWCPQLAVLAHRAVGCFFSHCGWNSTLEAISLGVPIVAMPQWGDQPTNAKFVEDVWRVGVRVKASFKGIVEKEEIESSIRKIMEGMEGVEMRSNASKWKIQANAAMQEGGSSDRNIDDFVAKIKIESYN